MKHNIVLLFILSFFIIPFFVHAQNLLTGKVFDLHSNEPLNGAIITIPAIKTGAVSDSTGYYLIRNIPEGTYLIEVHLVGYATKLADIRIKGISNEDFKLEPAPTQLKDVIVTGVVSPTDNQKNPAPVTVVDNDYLLQNSSTNVIDAITKVPGVSGMTDGQSITKPVIRGLGYNRVLTINDGVEQVDQPWFDEFGIEADPNAVDRYEILKGPASLSYGSDAIAGVVNLIPEQPLAEGETKADAMYNYQTNNGLIAAMAHMAGTKHGVSWSARIDNTMAHAYRNPNDGYVINSQFSNFNTDGTIGLHRKWGYTQLHASYFEMHTGIVDGTRDSATGQMERAVSYPDLNGGEATYELPTHQEQISYTPFVIDQRIRHSKIVWDNSYAVGKGTIKALFSWQKNQRQEDNDPTNPNTPIIYYSSNALTYDLKYIFPQKGGFNMSVGTNGVYQSSQSLGLLMLIPNYKYFQIGAYAIASQQIGNLNLSGGVRYDTRSFNGLDHWVDSTTQEPAVAGAPNAFHEFEGFTSHFSGLSFSAGGAYNFTKDIYAKLNIARGWRAPNVAECGANGVHDGTVVYEIGDHSLIPETSLEEDFTFGVNSNDVTFELNVFNNDINDFIYAKGLTSVFGGDSINNTLNAVGLGAAPVYKYTQGKAALYGGEISLNIHPSVATWIELGSSLSTVYGSLTNVPDSVKYLPFVPPARITSDLKFNFHQGKSIRNAYLKFGMQSYSEQKNVYQQYAIYNGLNTALTPHEYAASKAATKGYILFSAGIGGTFISSGRTFFQLYLVCNNLFNTAYMDYMSRFKYYPVNYTTDRVGVFNMGRNLSIKILVPLQFGVSRK
jgi:iron complex outermembrane receptor protein